MTSSVEKIEQADNRETWKNAVEWVENNRKLIRRIAVRYAGYMSADSNDLYQEAIISAFHALISSREKKRSQQFVPFFRVIYRTNCIRLAAGLRTVPLTSDYPYYSQCDLEQMQKEQEFGRIAEALQVVTKRQREICLWLLKQKKPAGTRDLSRQFNFSRRHACRLVSASIRRIAGESR